MFRKMNRNKIQIRFSLEATIKNKKIEVDEDKTFEEN